MFNVCPACGIYSVEKAIDASGPYAICPHCGYAQHFLQLPLFIVTGASGSGKTVACLSLVNSLPECVVLESDILWRAEFATPEIGYASYRDVWLRLAKNIGQNGRPVVLCGSAIPEQYEKQPERRYFSALHYIALICDDETLTQRLKMRPQWRESGSPQFIEEMLNFNRWLRENAGSTTPPMSLLDTTGKSVEETSKAVAEWVRSRLKRPIMDEGRKTKDERS